MGTAPSLEDSIKQLNSFLRGELSAVETYRQAIEKAETDAVREQLVACQLSHSERVQLLRDRIIALGGKPDESSGAWGSFTKAIEGAASAFGERAAVDALEEGEDHGLADYSSDLDKLDMESRRIVELRVLPAQATTHRTLSTLKHALH